MDWYTAGLNRLVTDSRSCRAIEEVTGVKGRTIHDIKSGKAKFDNLRFGTVKKIAAHYFTKQVTA